MLHMQHNADVDSHPEELIEEMTGACLVMRARLISRVLSNVYDDALRPFGLNSAQFALLVVIHKLAPASRAEVGRFHHQDRSTLTRNLALVLKHGWVAEGQRRVDGLSRPLSLTAAGVELLAGVAPAWREAQKRALALIGDAGAAALSDVGNRILLSAI